MAKKAQAGAITPDAKLQLLWTIDYGLNCSCHGPSTMDYRPSTID